MKNLRKSNPKIVAWVTKYALTKGIMKIEGEICNDLDANMFSFETDYTHSVFKNEWFQTEAEALAHVEIMRKKKIASLTKQINKITNQKIKII